MTRLWSDLPELRPTVLHGPPSLFMMIHDRYLQLLANTDSNSAVAMTQIREDLGGRVGFISTGGSLVPSALVNFLKDCFPGVTLTVGYV